MRKTALAAVQRNGSTDDKLKWAIDAIQALGRASQIPENTAGIVGISDYIRTLLDDPDAATARATLGIVGRPHTVWAGDYSQDLTPGNSSPAVRMANSAAIAAVIAYAIANGFKEVWVAAGTYWCNSDIGVGNSGPDQKSLGFRGSGGGAAETENTILRFVDVTTAAVIIGNGQFMQLSDMAIVGETSPTSRAALTGTGVGFNHNTHQIRLDNVRVVGFETCYKSGYDGNVLCDSVTFYNCAAIGYIGWHISQTQNYINSLHNCVFNCTIDVLSDAGKAINVVGGNYSTSDAKRKAFTISSVSGLSTFTDSAQIGDAPFTNASFTAVVSSPDDPMEDGCYDAFVINTAEFGPIPLRMLDWNEGTSTITLTFYAWWLLGSGFQVNFAGDFGTLLGSVVSAATKLYCCETITPFRGLSFNVSGVHVENPGALTTLLDMESGFGGDDGSKLERITFNYNLDQSDYHGGADDDEAVFLCQQAFPFLWLRGYSTSGTVVEVANITTAGSTDRVMIDCIGRGKHRLINRCSNLKPNLRTLEPSGSNFEVEVIHRGFGEWDETPFLADGDSFRHYSARKFNSVPFVGYFPAEHAQVALRAAELADIDDGLGSLGTYPPLVGRRPYRVNYYSAFDTVAGVNAARWVESDHFAWSYGQDVVTNWSFVAGTNVVFLDDTSFMLAGLRIYFDEDGQSATDRYIVTGVYATLGFITVVRSRSGTGLLDLAGTYGTSYSGTTVRQEAFSFSRKGFLPPYSNVTNSNAGAQTAAVGDLTGAEQVNLLLTAIGAANFTTRTAAQMYGDIPGCYPGMRYEITINNTNAGTLTLVGGTGVTIHGTATVATNIKRRFQVDITSATAIDITNIDAVTTL